MEITPEQKTQLDIWATQRDAILGEISILKIEHETLTKHNNNLGISNTEIITKINQAEGRLIEFNKKEEEYKNIITLDTARLIEEKTKLQTEVTALRGTVSGLNTQIFEKTEIIKTLVFTHEKVFDRAAALDTVIDHVTRISDKNIFDMDEYFGKLKTSVKGLIDVNEENIGKTNIVLSSIHKYIFEMEKPVTFRHTVIPRQK